MKNRPLGPEAVKDLESRARSAHRTMGEICEAASVAHSTWSRAKARGRIRLATLEAIEGAIRLAETKEAG